ncbi:MAG: hypothetical protein HY736_01095 [Verrucomicrobia bacterium]|nr:hypothetical protein [Verrucomicrobiota bacterium]
MSADTPPPADLPPPTGFLRRVHGWLPAGWRMRSGLIAALLTVVALVPVGFTLAQVALVIRNVAYWDELDTAIAMLLKFEAGASWREVLNQLFAVNNEHRMLTSRLFYAGSYWLTGTVNFIVIGIVGNLCLIGLCALLVATAGPLARRVRMGVLLAFLMFQLQHYENLLWPGASIDHFQVVLLAAAAVVALARGTRPALLAAGLLGLLATFTLAHGLMIWPVGALALTAGRRWRHLGLWLGFGAAATAFFFQGFGVNPAHQIGDVSVAGLGRKLHYWLALLGAPLALGVAPLAPFLGFGLLALLGRRVARGARSRERIALPLAAWALAALLLISFGRADLTHGHVYSRYYVLGALAWALALFMEFEDWSDAAHPFRPLLYGLPLLIAFNVAANVRFASFARAWTTCRNDAVHFYIHYGVDGRGTFALLPAPAWATQLLERAERTGVFRMPVLCHRRSFRDPRHAPEMGYFVDRIPVDSQMVAIEGWAAFAGRESKPGQIHLVLQSAKSRLIFTTLPMERPDVIAVHTAERWRHAGFRFQTRRWLLPAEDFQLGLLIASERGVEFTMTAHRLDLTGAGRGILATGP